MPPKLLFYNLLFSLFIGTCANNQPNHALNELTIPVLKKELMVGAEQLDLYLPIINNQRVGLVVNQTSMIQNTHLVDTLLTLGIQIKKIFSPEHGFRGTADAGEHVSNKKDVLTGLPLLSLYGKNKKPTKEDLAGIDYLIFDIQDVGARFYTYISTLNYVMEACAENKVKVLVLDRPNPNGHYIDGPLLEKKQQSFVGLNPTPVVHGMTVGEYANMLNGEAWLKNGAQCSLEVIPCMNYTHKTTYQLPIKPSPNLPNNRAIYLYPSLCFFEGTIVSVGRGTDKQFQIYGYPDFSQGLYEFTPVSKEGAKYPKHENKVCKGVDLTTIPIEKLKTQKNLNLSYLLDCYKHTTDKKNFFNKNGFFDKLAGTDALREQIIAGWSEEEIRATWANDLEKFKQIRKKYLLYEDF